MKKQLLFIILIASAIATAYAQKHTISGTVTDAASGETLIGATVYDLQSGQGAVTNQYGFYSLTLKDDSVHLRISFVGYTTVIHHLLLNADRTINQALNSSIELHEVVVTAERPT